MYELLIAKIGTTLGKVARVKDSFNVPKTKLDAYPAVFYFPAGMENTFDSGQENFKIYRFTLMVIVGLEQTTKENAIMGALAKTVDDIIAQFDTDWNQGTFEGHRIWVKVDSADAWQISEEAEGQEAYAPLNVEIKLLSTN